jgi:hypothetical protein
LEADQDYIARLLDGRLENYRTTTQRLHADGHLLWLDLSMSCLRDPVGEVEYLVAQCVDVTEAVNARDLLARREEENRLLAERLQMELDNAAEYVKSILPAGTKWPIETASRYLPALDLGGDVYDYRWIDDDHLMIYLVDVSGHGVRPALLAVALHNLLRSGSLPPAVLRNPDHVLDAINRLFPSENQAGSYSTIWYGVYQRLGHFGMPAQVIHLLCSSPEKVEASQRPGFRPRPNPSECSTTASTRVTPTRCPTVLSSSSTATGPSNCT